MDIIVSMYTRHTTLSRVGHSLVLNLNWSMLFGMHVPGPSGVVLRENPPVAQLPELHTGANRQTAMVFFFS